MDSSKKALFGALLTTLAYSAQAEDVPPGQALHEANCVRCHDDGVYTREDRRVTSLAGLNKQVNLCNNQIGLQLFDDEVQQVVDYLNANYYKF